MVGRENPSRRNRLLEAGLAKRGADLLPKTGAREHCGLLSGHKKGYCGAEDHVIRVDCYSEQSPAGTRDYSLLSRFGSRDAGSFGRAAIRSDRSN